MNIIESVDISIAMANLDIAMDQLQYLLNDRNFPLDRTDSELIRRAHDICTYSRFVHMNVWRDRITTKRVQEDVILLLENAEKKVNELKEYCVSAKNKKEIAGWVTNIQLRTKNLRVNYVNGRHSDFAWDEIGPRQKKRFNNIIQDKNRKRK